MRADDEPSSSWIDLGPYRACLQPLGGEQWRFWVHGKPEYSQGYPQAVVLTSGWVQDGTLLYQPGCDVLAPDLEDELLVASRGMAARSGAP